MRSESEITKAVIRKISELDDCWCVKFHGNMYSKNGIPDILASFCGRFVAIEIKTESGKLRDSQRKIMLDMVDNGVACYIVHHEDDIDEIRRNISRCRCDTTSYFPSSCRKPIEEHK